MLAIFVANLHVFPGLNSAVVYKNGQILVMAGGLAKECYIPNVLCSSKEKSL